MQPSFRWTDGKDRDFQSFWLKTEEYYNQLVGGAGNRKAFMPYNISDSITDVLIAYDGSTAIGCAGLKPYSVSSAEIKRVWVEPSYRRSHIALEMMNQLEKKALENGSSQLILQTREIMTGAVRLYMLLLFIMFTAVIAVAWGIFGRAGFAAAAILMWGTGDAAAALVGIPFGKHKIGCRLTNGRKSREGSLAMLIVSFAAGILILIMAQGTDWGQALLLSGIGALAGTAAELFTPGEYDTVTVPVTILAVMLLLSNLY